MAKKKYQRNWLERKLDEYNHTMELIRTVLPFIILLLQIYNYYRFTIYDISHKDAFNGTLFD